MVLQKHKIYVLILILKQKFCVFTRHSLSSTKKLKNMKIWSSNIYFKNSKNQILNN